MKHVESGRLFRCAKVQHTPNLSHTQVRVMIWDQVRDTEKNVSATKVFCLHSPSRARHSLMSVRDMALKESVATTLSTNVDLATERLGVRVATTVVTMMKRKSATGGISNFGCAIPGLLAMLH